MGSSVSPDDVRFTADLEVGVDLALGRLGSRALAQLVDLALLFVVAFGVIPISAALVPAAIGARSVTLFMVLMILLEFGVFLGYFVLWELLWDGQTPGKRLLGLRVVHSDGTRLTLTACLVRNLLRPVDFLPFGYGIGLLVLVVTDRSQRLGDLAAGTVVVREARATDANAPRRWPERIRAGDAAMIEAFFAEAPTLLPERRERLAGEIMAFVRRDYPGFLADDAPGRSAWDTVREAFRPTAEG